MIKREHTGNPAAEAAALSQAIAESLAELNLILPLCEGEALDAIDFQVSLLEDANLVAPCWHMINNHASADGAWSATLSILIKNHLARALDLTALRDLVLGKLHGGQ